MKVYSLTLRNRFAATLLLLGLIGLGAVVLVAGFALLAGLAAAGTVLGAGAAIYNRIRGRNSMYQNTIHASSSGLDPSLEVFSGAPRRELPPG